MKNYLLNNKYMKKEATFDDRIIYKIDLEEISFEIIEDNDGKLLVRYCEFELYEGEISGWRMFDNWNEFVDYFENDLK